MFRQKVILALAAIGLFLLMPHNAHAVPSFARQTGQECNACHTFYPELTPFGRTFKLGGYTLSKSSKPYEFPPPITGSVMVTFTHTAEGQPANSAAEDNWANIFDSETNNFAYVLQETSIAYAGRVYGPTGAFTLGTYDGVGDTFFLDITDVRFANSTSVKETNLTYGVTLNNSPTLEDLWNSTPTWGFPHATSDVAPTPAAATIVDGTLDQQVGGLGFYAFWNDMLYGDITLYRTAREGITEFLGAGTPTDVVVDDVAPYWRFAFQHQWGEQTFEIGTYGIFANIFPAGETEGSTDQFTDVALDAQYQYISGNHIFTAAATWIHEFQDWDASHALGDTGRSSNHLDTFRINLNYYYRNHIGKIGGTVGYFLTDGGKDDVLYAPDPIDGSRTGSPESSGFILEADYLPFGGHRMFFEPRLTLQYIIYNQFNGSHSNYDGFGRDASDNNTLFLLAWLWF